MSEASDRQLKPMPRYMRPFDAYRRFADGLSEVMGTISQYLVIVVVVVGFVNLVLRETGKRLGTQLTNNGLIETQWYIYGIIFLLAFGYILKHQINVRVDFWFADQPPRRKALIDFVGHLISLVPFAVIGLWVSLDAVQFSWQINEQSPDPSGLPRAPIKTMILVGFILLLIQAIAELIKLIGVFQGWRHYEAPAEEFTRVE